MGYEEFVRLDYTVDDLINFKGVVENFDRESLAPAVNASTICGGLREALHQALTEIYSTDEGRELIEAAAANSPDGKVLFIDDPTMGAAAYAELGIINLGVLLTRDSTYVSIEDGELKDFSLQRVLAHEFFHLTQDTSNVPQQYKEQTTEERLSDLPPVETEEYIQYRQTNEREAIEFANAFMRKYYGEAYRNTDYTGTYPGAGTPAYDLATFGAVPSPEFLSNVDKYQNDPDYRKAVDGFTQATIDAAPDRSSRDVFLEMNTRLAGEQCAAALQ